MPTSETKRQIFSANNGTQWDALFPPPPVCHAKWSVTDWVNWVNHCGKWVRK